MAIQGKRCSKERCVRDQLFLILGVCNSHKSYKERKDGKEAKV